MKVEDKDDFLGRWADGRLSEEELNQFKSSQDFDVYKKILEGSTQLSSSPFDVEKSLQDTKTKLGETGKSLTRSLWPVWSAAAAAVILIISYITFIQADTIQTGYGELAVEMLPDGSTVQANANTTLKYKSRSWSECRDIRLEGEAYFEVAKGATFTVSSSKGNVQVLGTRFNVYDREGVLEVKCFEGKVKVSGNKELILEAGDSYREVAEEVERTKMTNQLEPRWINSESTFKNSPISQVLLELSNQYKLTFEGNIPPVGTRITVSFPNDNQELALDQVFKSLQTTYQKKSQKVIVID